MKREEKIDLLIENSDFCEGLGLSGANDEYKKDYLSGFKDKEIDTFYYEFIDLQ